MICLHLFSLAVIMFRFRGGMVADEMLPQNDGLTLLEYYPKLEVIEGKLLDQLVEDAVDWAHVSLLDNGHFCFVFEFIPCCCFYLLSGRCHSLWTSRQFFKNRNDIHNNLENHFSLFPQPSLVTLKVRMLIKNSLHQFTVFRGLNFTCAEIFS